MSFSEILDDCLKLFLKFQTNNQITVYTSTTPEVFLCTVRISKYNLQLNLHDLSSSVSRVPHLRVNLRPIVTLGQQKQQQCQSFSCVRLFAIPKRSLISLQPTRLLCLQDFPGQNTGVGCHFLLQGIFPTRGSNPALPHCRWILCQLSHKGGYSSPILLVESIKSTRNQVEPDSFFLRGMTTHAVRSWTVLL